MKIQLLFAASCREATGCRDVEHEVDEGATVGALRRDLVERFPGLSGLSSALSVAVNAEYADESTVLRPGDQVALIPPVSGG